MEIVEIIHNVETNEISQIEREMTADELEAHKKWELATAEKLAVQNEISEKRQALLSKLGLTEAEAKLLLS